LVTVLAAVALSLGASAVYLLNDLLDLPNDRRHERKRHRPLAAGRIRLPRAAVAAVLLLAGGLAVGWAAGPAVAAVVAVHATVTTLYSFRLKRIPLVDVFTLTGLYLIRPIAGALATGLAFSPWLAALVFFLFLSLALAKRSAELQRIRPGAAPGRGWHRRDRPVVDAFGIGTGIAAAVILSLYLFSDKVALLYREPMWLWPVVALLLAWILRVWLKTARGRMHHDPLVFALTDGPTWGVAIAVAVCVLLGTLGVRW
jgi:4-hydroxybenzoate polyprenyltransferase